MLHWLRIRASRSGQVRQNTDNYRLFISKGLSRCQKTQAGEEENGRNRPTKVGEGSLRPNTSSTGESDTNPDHYCADGAADAAAKGQVCVRAEGAEGRIGSRGADGCGDLRTGGEAVGC